jgi:hypothetical protein
MKWYLQNLRFGLRTAFFFPAPQRVAGSWHALMAVAATTVLSQIMMEFVVDGTGGEIAYSSYGYLACLFVLTLIVSYIISFFASRDWPVVDISVAFLNSYYFIFLPYAFVQIAAADKFYHSGFSSLAQYLIPAWAFLVMFRVVRATCAPNLRKLVLSGLLAAGAIYLLNSQVFFSRIYYVETPSEQRVPSALDKLTSEEVFDMQAGLRQKSQKQLKASEPGHTDIYALTLGTYSYQDVFMRDVRYVDKRLKGKLGITNIIPMINNTATVETIPLANATNLRSYLGALSSRFMQPKEDILLIFLTSHGSAKEGLAVNLGYRFSQLDISPQRLKKILDDSGIQNRIIVISACYSGVFIPDLKDEHTMVITAAAKDRVSFGCSDNNDLTYFTQAYFMDALSKTTDLEKAFHIAKIVVERREAAMGITEHSNPQLFIGKKIKDILRNYTGANIASLRPLDAAALAWVRKAADQVYKPAQAGVELAADVKKANEWLRLTAHQWQANAFYVIGFLLLVFAGVVYRYNPDIFRRGGWKSRGVAKRIFSSAVCKTYALCLGVIVIMAWLAWCVSVIST